jgi:hypothetical protein
MTVEGDAAAPLLPHPASLRSAAFSRQEREKENGGAYFLVAQ